MRIAPVDAWGHPIDLRLTLDGGQTFTWWERSSSDQTAFEGLLGGHKVHLTVDPSLAPGTVLVEEPASVRLAAAVRHLLDLRRDYRTAQARLATEDPALAEAISATAGLRVVRLTPWEALLSFLLSTHTHVPRIKAMLASLVQRFGPGGSQLPLPSVLARAGEGSLRALGLGYRARYVHRTACRLAAEPKLLERWSHLPTPRLREQLLALPGVGRKVADCVLLFGYGRWDVFPVDRWVRRAVEALYFEGRHVPASRVYREMEGRFGELAGLAQAHLFAYWRQLGRKPAQARNGRGR